MLRDGVKRTNGVDRVSIKAPGDRLDTIPLLENQLLVLNVGKSKHFVVRVLEEGGQATGQIIEPAKQSKQAATTQ